MLTTFSLLVSSSYHGASSHGTDPVHLLLLVPADIMGKGQPLERTGVKRGDAGLMGV